MSSPKREGVTSGERQSRLPFQYETMQVSRAAGLTDLQQEYVFFTLALLFTDGGFEVDPIADYVREKNPKSAPFRLDLPYPVFDEVDEWDHRILLCPKKEWANLYNFLKVLGGVNHDKGSYFRMLAQLLPVVDVLALSRMASLPDPIPMVNVLSFGLDGNKAIVAFEPIIGDMFGRYRPVVKPPDPEMVAIGSAFLAEAPKPFQAAEGSNLGHRDQPAP